MIYDLKEARSELKLWQKTNLLFFTLGTFLAYRQAEVHLRHFKLSYGFAALLVSC
jgi:hypothetical protein